MSLSAMTPMIQSLYYRKHFDRGNRLALKRAFFLRGSFSTIMFFNNGGL